MMMVPGQYMTILAGTWCKCKLALLGIMWTWCRVSKGLVCLYIGEKWVLPMPDRQTHRQTTEYSATQLRWQTEAQWGQKFPKRLVLGQIGGYLRGNQDFLLAPKHKVIWHNAVCVLQMAKPGKREPFL